MLKVSALEFHSQLTNDDVLQPSSQPASMGGGDTKLSYGAFYDLIQLDDQLASGQYDSMTGDS